MLLEILQLVRGLANELERYRDMLPEPGSIAGRMLRRKAASSAVTHWQGG